MHENEALQEIINSLNKIKDQGLSSEITEFKLRNLIPFDIKRFYKFHGSFTTPPCTEVVEFFIVDSPKLNISIKQIFELQKLRDENKDFVS